MNDDELFKDAIRDGIREGIKNKFSNHYNGPLDKLVENAVKEHSEPFRALLNDAIKSSVEDSVFREDIKQSVRTTLAKILVQRFGGEIEKQVNALKSDPTTRARITMAIEEIVQQKTEATELSAVV
jgi:hypothetical protein